MYTFVFVEMCHAFFGIPLIFRFSSWLKSIHAYMNDIKLMPYEMIIARVIINIVIVVVVVWMLGMGTGALSSLAVLKSPRLMR